MHCFSSSSSVLANKICIPELFCQTNPVADIGLQSASVKCSLWVMRDEASGIKCHRQPASPIFSPENLHPELPLFWERQDALPGLLCEATIMGTLVQICFCILTIVTSPAQEGETILYMEEKYAHFAETWLVLRGHTHHFSSRSQTCSRSANLYSTTMKSAHLILTQT